MKLWRFGQLDKTWKYFVKGKKLSFNWMDSDTDYLNVKDLRAFNGWTCIEPWVNELRKGDLVFIVSRYLYAGVAIAKSNYKFKGNDFKIDNRLFPCIDVEFIHFLDTPIEHKFNISHKNPKTFARVGELGFSSFKILEFIKSVYPNVFNKIGNYITDNIRPEKDKISRICWNTNKWRYPSGVKDKSKDKNAYENINGFGHEEWIANNTRIINGYQYSFLQPLNMKSNGHVDKIYKIYLYTVDGNNNFFLAGEINNAFCISKDESKYAHEIFVQKGYLKEMIDEVNMVGINDKSLEKMSAESFFNLKFKPSDIIIYDDFKIISNNDRNITAYYYRLLDKKFRFVFEENSDNDDFEDIDKNTNDVNKQIKGKKITINPIHNKIQNALKKHLKNTNEFSVVRLETKGVDVYAKTKDGKVYFYEVKTSSSKYSIREALGQIMEYAYWPNLKKADKLFIVSDGIIDIQVKDYMNYLRNTFNIPIYYMSYSFTSEKFTKAV